MEDTTRRQRGIIDRNGPCRAGGFLLPHGEQVEIRFRSNELLLLRPSDRLDSRHVVRIVVASSLLEFVGGRGSDSEDGDGAEGVADEEGGLRSADGDEVEGDEGAAPGSLRLESLREGVDGVDDDLLGALQLVLPMSVSRRQS